MPAFKPSCAFLLLLGLGAPSWAAKPTGKILKIDPGQKAVAVSQPKGHAWGIDDYLCVMRRGMRLACGPITKMTHLGALVTIEYRASSFEVGDSVEATRWRPPKLPKARSVVTTTPAGGDEVSALLNQIKEKEQKSDDELRRNLAAQAGVKPDSPPPPPVAPEPPRTSSTSSYLGSGRSGRSSGGEAVDLNNLEMSHASGAPAAVSSEKIETAEATYRGHGNFANTPKFKVLFDLWLTYRPGIPVPLTFDTYHNLLMLEFYPDPSFYFGFEVSPSPRYYELDYSLSRKWTLRLGRIYIPFDDLSPHSIFGGRANVSKMLVPNGASFLPDLWTDLGVGIKYQWIETRDTSVELHAYAVNGFQDGGTDPLALSPSYPSFSNIPFVDNNTDKALGARIHASFLSGRVGLGASVYRCRYSSENLDPASLLMAGVDAQLRLGTTEFRTGYLYAKVSLLGTDGYLKGGFYGELGQRFKHAWKALVRFGQSQDDSRVILFTDQTVVGGTLVYQPGPVQLSLDYSQDLNNIPGKTYYSFVGGRLLMAF